MQLRANLAPECFLAMFVINHELKSSKGMDQNETAAGPFSTRNELIFFFYFCELKTWRGVIDADPVAAPPMAG